MDHASDIRDVNAHPESTGGEDDLDVSVHERKQRLVLLAYWQLCIERSAAISQHAETFGKGACPPCLVLFQMRVDNELLLAVGF